MVDNRTHVEGDSQGSNPNGLLTQWCNGSTPSLESKHTLCEKQPSTWQLSSLRRETWLSIGYHGNNGVG